MIDCDLGCYNRQKLFDNILKKETNFNLTLETITHSNIGWFIDKTIVDGVFHLKEWHLPNEDSIYFLWLKEGYCPIHEIFLMKCLYIGKGKLSDRIISHLKRKDFSEEMIVYFSFVTLQNRQSKYIEQLLLDIYNIPLNKNENSGNQSLYEYFTQSEVD